MEDGRRLHVPRILLSASAEFQAAYSQQPPQQPNLRKILVEDIRVKNDPWYQEGMKTPPSEASKFICVKSPDSGTVTVPKNQRQI